MRYFLKLAYNGTKYFGWQTQPNHITVQEVLDGALLKLLNKPVYTLGCGRTDTGVHAKKFFAHVDIEEDLPDEFHFKLNCVLPKDIVILEIIPVEKERHARFDAISRTYQYFLHFKKDPFLEPGSFCYPFHVLDFEKIIEATELLLSYQDFKPLCRYNQDRYKHTRCNLTEARWEEISETGQMKFTITANRFLRSMVRRIVGAMVLIGRGKMTIGELKKVMDDVSEFKIKIAVPPQGLYLVDVQYPYIS